MSQLTLRSKLTLWNMAALGTVMSALIVGIFYDLARQENDEIERELSQRAQFFAGFMRNGPPPPPKSAGKPHSTTNPPAKPDSKRDAGKPTSAIPVDRELERIQWFRGPRFVGRDGKGPGPWPFPLWDAPAIVRGLTGRKQLTFASSRGERIRVLTLPVFRDRELLGVVQVARELGDFDRMWAHRYRFVAILLPVALLVAGMGGTFLTSRALRPIHLVTQTASQIGEEDLSRRLPVYGRDELAELSATFNRMIERLEGAFQSRAQAYDRLERAYVQQKQFTSDASHELRTPLTRIKMATSAALQSPQSQEEYQEALAVADRAADTMKLLIEQLLLLARADVGQLRPSRDRIDLQELLMDACSTFYTPPVLTLKLPIEPMYIAGDSEMLARVLSNLLENASRHTPTDGSVIVCATTEENRAILRIEDTGEGIPGEHLPHVFERFYRVDASRTRSTNGSGGGTGLGLAICKGIVEAHGGEICIDSLPGQGTTVTVTLPLFCQTALQETAGMPGSPV